MTIQEAISARHSVRSYQDKALDREQILALNEHIAQYNQEGDLHIQLVLNEPKAFDCFRAHYGKFSGVSNYIALIGKKGKDLDEKIGYYGEKLVLLAQTLGLSTCWVAMTYQKIKTAFRIEDGEKLRMVIALGYGNVQGVAHKNKPIEKVALIDENTPAWFKNGVQAALLAPTAMNQQKFFFSQTDGVVEAKCAAGFYTKVDFGIVKCHFEIGAGKENFTWKH